MNFPLVNISCAFSKVSNNGSCFLITELTVLFHFGDSENCRLDSSGRFFLNRLQCALNAVCAYFSSVIILLEKFLPGCGDKNFPLRWFRSNNYKSGFSIRNVKVSTMDIDFNVDTATYITFLIIIKLCFQKSPQLMQPNNFINSLNQTRDMFI